MDTALAEAPSVGHNSQESVALEYFQNRVRIDAAREELNAQADANRQMARDAELNTAALDVEYKEWKTKTHEKEGFKESRSVGRKVLSDDAQGDLFAELERAKDARREKKRALSKGA